VLFRSLSLGNYLDSNALGDYYLAHDARFASEK
jgi:hypothetical protein